MMRGKSWFVVTPVINNYLPIAMSTSSVENIHASHYKLMISFIRGTRHEPRMMKPLKFLQSTQSWREPNFFKANNIKAAHTFSATRLASFLAIHRSLHFFNSSAFGAAPYRLHYNGALFPGSHAIRCFATLMHINVHHTLIKARSLSLWAFCNGRRMQAFLDHYFVVMRFSIRSFLFHFDMVHDLRMPIFCFFAMRGASLHCQFYSVV